MMKSTRLPAHSEWEKIQGFDQNKREYVRLDCDAWLNAHKIREEGKRRGKLNQPDSDDKLPDETFRKIESWIEKRASDCKETVSKYVTDELASLNHLGTSEAKENPEINLESLITQHCQNLRTTADQSVSDLDSHRTEYKDAARDLKEFRQKNKLKRVAHYPDNKIAHWLWVLVAGIVESFISANLLGSVSQGGIIEGWVLAGVLTAVNIFLGICAGQLWRFTHYGWGFKPFAFVLSTLCAALALVWNNVAGHVRDVYVSAAKTGALETVDEALATAVYKMIERPLPWENLPSAGLALVGIFVFFLTAYKSYTADDPFPGYGAKHRKVEDLHGRYQDNLNDALENLKTVRDEANVMIEESKYRYEMDRADWESTLDRLKMVINNYSVNLRQYNKDMNHLLAAYRTANLAARTTPHPLFFDIEPTIDQELLEPPPCSIPDRPEWGDIPKKAEAGYKRIEKIYDQLLPRYQMIDRVVEDYDEDIS